MAENYRMCVYFEYTENGQTKITLAVVCNMITLLCEI